MVFKKIVTVCIVFSFLFSGCATKNRTSSTVGPPLSSSFSKPEGIESVAIPQKLDLIIPVFDPGLPEGPVNSDKEDIWPELRRAEANRFAYKLK
jgi:hypothetical protein